MILRALRHSIHRQAAKRQVQSSYARPLSVCTPPPTALANPSNLPAFSRLASTMTEARPTRTNALIHATSPYLLQHAHNPVDWQLWSKETLQKAKEQNKMIFLSSGYSACHWCHVMAHESFENEEIAKVLNEHFVCVKLDREERPDVDAAYMTFIQATSGRGGWPMSVFLTSDAEPLFGGTYFPPPMFISLIDRLTGLWETDRERCVTSARDISAQLRQVATSGVSGTNWDDLPDLSLSAKVLRNWLLAYDEEDGGFGNAPKFPSPPNTFHVLHRIAVDVLREREQTSSGGHSLLESGISQDSARRALEASAFTLARIARGGITDHLAGGIARYSVDEEWRVPHFEKMLYDQGQLLTSFTEALQLCQSSDSAVLREYVPEFVGAIEGIVAYLDRYMRDADGSIYAAEDADSLPTSDAKQAKEGAFYVWELAEVEGVLGKKTQANDLVVAHFGIKLDGNIPPHSDPHGELVGKNMLHASLSLAQTASRMNMDERRASELLEQSKRKLLAFREQRPRPLRDDKIVTAWNGLAVSGLANASRALIAIDSSDKTGERALSMAKQAAEFLWTTMWDAQSNRFIRSYRQGVKGPEGVDVDYAFVVQAFLDLYEATFESMYIDRALEVQAAQDALFWDHSGPGGYLISSAESDGNVLGRQRGDQEGAEPTSTSVSTHNLLRLQSLISDLDAALAAVAEKQDPKNDKPALPSSRDRIAQCITSGGAVLNRAPHALGMRVTGLIRARLGPVQALVIGPRAEKKTQDLLSVVAKHFFPRMSTILIDTTNGVQGAQEALGSTLAQGNDAVRETLADPKLLQRGSYVSICQNFACGLPISDPATLLAELQR